jgi:hypothetical protein
MALSNDLDGRGALSEEALAEFTQFFLKICIDQVTFMVTPAPLWAPANARHDALFRHSWKRVC